MNTYKYNIQELWNTIKISNLLYIHVKEAFQILSRHDQKRTTPHHIITKRPRLQNKKRILKDPGEKYTGNTYTLMFTASLFTIAKLWKQPRCPTTDEQTGKM
jgi:hypothetical protein